MSDAMGVIAVALSRETFCEPSVLAADNPWEPGAIGAPATDRAGATDVAERCPADDLHLARSLIQQARLFRERGEVGRAEPLLQWALALQEQALGLVHPHVAITLTHLMYVYRRQGKETPAVAAQTRATQILTGLG